MWDINLPLCGHILRGAACIGVALESVHDEEIDLESEPTVLVVDVVLIFVEFGVSFIIIQDELCGIDFVFGEHSQVRMFVVVVGIHEVHVADNAVGSRDFVAEDVEDNLAANPLLAGRVVGVGEDVDLNLVVDGSIGSEAQHFLCH